MIGSTPPGTWIGIDDVRGKSASADEIAAFCRGEIAHHKAPRHIRFVPELPITAAGKPQKFIMQTMMREPGRSEAKTA